MKDLFNTTTNRKGVQNGISSLQYFVNKTNRSHTSSHYNRRNDITGFEVTKENLLTHNAYLQMAAGMIPDLWNICRELYSSLFENGATYSALQFVPVMQKLLAFDKDQIQRLLKNRETRHVLVENNKLTVVLIYWKPGKISNIHGHPKGGCVFKVLHGKLEELRYATDESQTLLSSNGYRAGSMTYIDDRLGYHAVGNPFGRPAISLHAYTPGR